MDDAYAPMFCTCGPWNGVIPPPPCALHDLLRAARRQLSNAADRRPAECLVDGRDLPYPAWADAVDRCRCAVHRAAAPTLTIVPKEHPAA